MEAQQLTLKKLQALLERHPDLLQTPAFARAIAELERQEAIERLKPVCQAIRKLLEREVTRGVLEMEDIAQISIGVQKTDQGKAIVVDVTSEKAGAPRPNGRRPQIRNGRTEALSPAAMKKRLGE